MSFVAHAVVATCISALTIGVYDVTVRQPRTPRLAVVDIARIYAAADRSFKDRALVRGAEDGVPAASSPDGARRLGRAEDFGPALEAELRGLSRECRCAIVAMATVVGGDTTIPDVTLEAAHRLGLQLREAATP